MAEAENKVAESTEKENKFEAITSQEQLDSIIKGRLDRESKKHSEATAELQKELEQLRTSNTEMSTKLKGYDEKYANVDSVIADLQGKVRNYETDSVKTRVSREYGIPWEMRDRLRGETEEEIRADARTFSELLPKSSAPRKSSDTSPASGDTHSDGLREALRRMTSNSNE